MIKKMRFVFFRASIFVLGISTHVEAQKGVGLDESLQEFFTGETVYAQERKEVQFTLKPAYWKKEGLKMLHIPLQVEYGFSDRFQVELQLPYYNLHPKIGQTINGMGNVEVGFLYNYLKGNGPFALSLALDIGLPTANKQKEIDEAEIEWEPTLIVAKKIGIAQVHASVGAEITKTESAFYYNLATVVPIGDWRATLELSGKINEQLIYLTPGVLWKGIDDFEFGIGFSKGNSAWGVILMATHEFSLPTRMKQQR
ncbi:MAG: hypothetical protein ABWZ25_17745 [Chitinophagaceae bacterium]